MKPKPLRADDSNVQELIRKLADAKMDLSASDEDQKKAAAAFASGKIVGVAKVTDASGTAELQVRKNKDDYYAKSSAVDGVYKVGSDLGTALDKGVDDFRSKKLFDFGFTDPDKIELHDGAKAYYLTKGGTLIGGRATGRRQKRSARSRSKRKYATCRRVNLWIRDSPRRRSK